MSKLTTIAAAALLAGLTLAAGRAAAQAPGEPGLAAEQAVTAPAPAAGGIDWDKLIKIAALLGLAIAAAACGLGQGRAGGAALDGIARNPGAAGKVFVPLLLVMAFIESLTLYTFIMVLIL